MNIIALLFLLLVSGCSNLQKEQSLEERVYSTFINNAKKELQLCQKSELRIREINNKDHLTKEETIVLIKYLETFQISSFNRYNLITHFLLKSPSNWKKEYDKELSFKKECDSTTYFSSVLNTIDNHWAFTDREHKKLLSILYFNIKEGLLYTTEPIKLNLLTIMLRRLIMKKHLKASEGTINEISSTIMYADNMYNEFREKLEQNIRRNYSIPIYREFYYKSQSIADHLSLLMSHTKLKTN